MNRLTSLGTLGVLLLAISHVSAAEATAPPSGLWDATVIVNEVEIPFRFELQLKPGHTQGAFFNGDERVRSTSGSYAGNALSLQFAHYASQLDATWSDGALSGSYVRSGGQPPYPFRAKPHVATTTPSAKVPSIAGQWDITVESPKGEAAWRFFVRQSGPEVSAAVLRVDGDTGVLTGPYRDGKFVLSHFSGARPLLLEVTPNTDGTLAVVQNGKTAYTAVKSSDARAKSLPEPADPSRWTSVKDPSKPLEFAAVDLSGATVTQADPRFHGKVVLLNIMGSWCPNCHDEAPFLAELYRKYRKRGLEVVALTFEDKEQLRNPTRLRAFLAEYKVDYPVLLGGEPSEIGAKLPGAVRLNTWPATFIIGRDGLVRSAHAGFAGKATGAAHEQLKREITATVESLLRERS